MTAQPPSATALPLRMEDHPRRRIGPHHRQYAGEARQHDRVPEDEALLGPMRRARFMEAPSSGYPCRFHPCAAPAKSGSSRAFARRAGAGLAGTLFEYGGRGLGACAGRRRARSDASRAARRDGAFALGQDRVHHLARAQPPRRKRPALLRAAGAGPHRPRLS